MIFERKKLRLKGYDYSHAGYYFVTILVKGRECRFGNITNGELILNEYGEIAKKCWEEIPCHHINIELDEFIVMPNHIHGIIIINRKGVACNTLTKSSTRKSNYHTKISPEKGTLSVIIRSFKSAVSKRLHDKQINFHWHRSFYDHIIKQDEDLDNIRHYIKYNYLKWQEDEYFLNEV